MEITTDFNITKLFVTKDVRIIIDKKQYFIIKCKTVSDFYLDESWIAAYRLLTFNETEWKQMLQIEKTEVYDYICFILFELGKYKQYKFISDNIIECLKNICPDIVFDYKTKQIIINDITMTAQIWNYLIYVLKLSCGEKTTQPLVFDSPEAKEFFLKQQEYENRINKVKANKEGTDDGLAKVLLAITYSFPSLTIDYLLQQTMAQIHWLQKMAAGEVSYSFNEKVFAAGNMKKGKKLDFFIK